MRNRAWRRAQRERVIRRRLFIVRNIWGYTPITWPWIRNGSRFAKYNFTCDSRMCKLAGNESRKEKRHREDLKHPLDMPL